MHLVEAINFIHCKTNPVSLLCMQTGPERCLLAGKLKLLPLYLLFHDGDKMP